MKTIFIRFPIIVLFFILTNSVNAEEYQGIVSRVIDGDTIDVKIANDIIKRVRLRYIDAPEKDQLFGKESTDFLKKNVLEKIVIINTEYKDRFKRDIGDIFIYDKNSELSNNSLSQHLHLKMPPLIILKLSPEKGGSVPFCLVT